MGTRKPAQGHCYRRLAGMELVYEPVGKPRSGKKYPCPDCSFCQFCTETRCLTCRSQGPKGMAAPCKKMSLQEQIRLYERVNAEAAEKG